jgi:hypothetical protein
MVCFFFGPLSSYGMTFGFDVIWIKETGIHNVNYWLNLKETPCA